MRSPFLYILLLFIIIFQSCTDEHKRMERALRNVQSRSIKLDLDKMLCMVNGHDTTVKDDNAVKLRIVNYVDSSQCSPCAIEDIFLWNDIMEEYGNKVRYTFIFAPKKEQLDEVKVSLESSGLKTYVYIDTAYMFRQLNADLPSDNRLHTMLLDENNNVKLVGNPLRGRKIKELYTRLITNN